MNQYKVLRMACSLWQSKANGSTSVLFSSFFKFSKKRRDFWRWFAQHHVHLPPMLTSEDKEGTIACILGWISSILNKWIAIPSVCWIWALRLPRARRRSRRVPCRCSCPIRYALSWRRSAPCSTGYRRTSLKVSKADCAYGTLSSWVNYSHCIAAMNTYGYFIGTWKRWKQELLNSMYILTTVCNFTLQALFYSPHHSHLLYVCVVSSEKKNLLRTQYRQILKTKDSDSDSG